MGIFSWFRKKDGPAAGTGPGVDTIDPGLMYCPQCHGEYRAGFVRCAACDVELVSGAIHHLLPMLKKAQVPEQGQDLVMKFFKNLGGAPVVIAVTIGKRPDDPANLTNVQSGAALFQNLLLAAHAEGLGTCWMTGAHSLETEILKFLGKEDQQLLAITPIGYSDREPPVPPRKGREVRWLGF